MISALTGGGLVELSPKVSAGRGRIHQHSHVVIRDAVASGAAAFRPGAAASAAVYAAPDAGVAAIGSGSRAAADPVGAVSSTGAFTSGFAATAAGGFRCSDDGVRVSAFAADAHNSTPAAAAAAADGSAIVG